MTVRFGMVGTGAMAEQMLPAFRHAQGVELVAVASRTEERAKAFAARHSVPSAYASIEALLADGDVDAVYVANATGAHAEASIAALKAGKHVLCEKPFAMTAEEGARVIDAAKASGKLFMEGLWTHLLPSYQRVYELAQAKSLGAPVQLTAAYGYPAPREARPRLYDKADGGVLLDLVVYPLSLALRLMGPAAALNAEVRRDADGIDTHASLQLVHDNGGFSQLAVSFDAMLSNAASLACMEGLVSMPAPLFGAETVIVERFSPSSREDRGGAAAKLKSVLKQNPILRRVKQAMAGGERHPYGADQYLPQMNHFLALLSAGKTESDIISHEFSLDILRIIDRIRAQEKDRP